MRNLVHGAHLFLDEGVEEIRQLQTTQDAGLDISDRERLLTLHYADTGPSEQIE